MTEKQLQEKIQNRCSLTKGDVAAVLAELHDLMVEELSLGRRFYIPEIGYFSMSAILEMPEENPDKKITGKEVRITGINFRPEGKLMEEVQRNVHFVRSRYSNQSTKYSEEKMLEKIKEYLQKNRYITTRIIRIHFGLTPYMAQKWLTISARKISWWRMELPMRPSTSWSSCWQLRSFFFHHKQVNHKGLRKRWKKKNEIEN